MYEKDKPSTKADFFFQLFVDFFFKKKQLAFFKKNFIPILVYFNRLLLIYLVFSKQKQGWRLQNKFFQKILCASISVCSILLKIYEKYEEKQKIAKTWEKKRKQEKHSLSETEDILKSQKIMVNIFQCLESIFGERKREFKN